jgi:hypothetical protein
MEIDYERFSRVVRRSVEVGTEQGGSPVVLSIYDLTFKDRAAAYILTEDAVAKATSSFEKENQEALKALADLDGPYRTARSAARAVEPTLVLPDTLKVLKTDTDKKLAIERLLDVIDDYAGQPWADALLGGELGARAPAAIKEIDEAIQASSGLSTAMSNRAKEYGPTYEKYLAFKRVVRDAYGPASPQYRRIHLRASPSRKGKEEETKDGAASNGAKTEAPVAPQQPAAGEVTSGGGAPQ